MCNASHYDSSSGLTVETWCGTDKYRGSYTLICWIDDYTTKAKHYVEVASIKTYGRQIVVKGRIPSRPTQFAMFSGSLAASATEWQDSTLVSPNKSSAVLGGVQVIKLQTGHEILDVEVYYEDPWKPGSLRVAKSFSRRLIVEVHLH
jgi:hypothetical protein